MKKVLSIIIPVYNVECYITRCLESILNQNTEECEIILVDDGSKDSSGSICDDYESKYKNVMCIHKKMEDYQMREMLELVEHKGSTFGLSIAMITLQMTA